jgi:hypothetical protein
MMISMQEPEAKISGSKIGNSGNRSGNGRLTRTGRRRQSGGYGGVFLPTNPNFPFPAPLVTVSGKSLPQNFLNAFGDVACFFVLPKTQHQPAIIFEPSRRFHITFRVTSDFRIPEGCIR